MCILEPSGRLEHPRPADRRRSRLVDRERRSRVKGQDVAGREQRIRRPLDDHAEEKRACSRDLRDRGLHERAVLDGLGTRVDIAGRVDDDVVRRRIDGLVYFLGLVSTDFFSRRDRLRPVGRYLQSPMDAGTDFHRASCTHLPRVGGHARYLDGLHQASRRAFGAAYFHDRLAALLLGLGGAGSLETLTDDTFLYSPSPL